MSIAVCHIDPAGAGNWFQIGALQIVNSFDSFCSIILFIILLRHTLIFFMDSKETIIFKKNGFFDDVRLYYLLVPIVSLSCN